MSDLLVHWAVFDDCRRLAQVDRQVDPLLREWVQSEREAGQPLGAAQVESALRAEANESHYGQALRTGVRYLRAASAF